MAISRLRVAAAVAGMLVMAGYGVLIIADPHTWAPALICSTDVGCALSRVSGGFLLAVGSLMVTAFLPALFTRQRSGIEASDSHLVIRACLWLNVTIPWDAIHQIQTVTKGRYQYAVIEWAGRRRPRKRRCSAG